MTYNIFHYEELLNKERIAKKNWKKWQYLRLVTYPVMIQQMIKLGFPWWRKVE